MSKPNLKVSLSWTGIVVAGVLAYAAYKNKPVATADVSVG